MVISVIVPIYKVEKYLRHCVESIRQQTYKDLEIILVDDGSPDKCPQICDEFASIDNRIKVIHKENGGASSARNAGLDAATGDYIAFVDGDDFIREKMYEVLLNKICESDADMVICSYDKVDEDGSRVPNQSPLRDELLESYELLQKIPNAKGWYYITLWNRLHKKEIFRNLRFQEGITHEDDAIAHRIAMACRKIVTTQESYYCYRRVADSAMERKATVKRLDGVEAVYGRYRCYEECGYQELLQGAFHSAREAFEIMRDIKCNTKEELERKREIKGMYRYMFRHTPGNKGLKDRMVAFCPELYFGIKRKILKSKRFDKENQ